MQKILSAAIVAAASTFAAAGFAAPETYTIDSSHSLQSYQYRHLGLSFAGGRFDKTTGTITLDTAAKTGSADISVDVNSLNTGVAKLDEHLKGKDFFEAAKYPAITFKSNSFKFTGDTLSSVSGDLSVHGVTRPVTLNVTNFACTMHPMMKVPACAANAEVTIKRSDFGVGGYVPMVSDETRLSLEVEAVAKK
jgi:polyisoprenoid-binding protein YceI